MLWILGTHNGGVVASIVIIIVLVCVIAGLVYQDTRQEPIDSRERRFVDRLAKWLTRQVALQCNVNADSLDQRAKNRIYGAARKAAKPLAEHGDVEIQLPNIVSHKHEQPKSFSIQISMNEIAHLRDD